MSQLSGHAGFGGGGHSTIAGGSGGAGGGGDGDGGGGHSTTGGGGGGRGGHGFSHSVHIVHGTKSLATSEVACWVIARTLTLNAKKRMQKKESKGNEVDMIFS